MNQVWVCQRGVAREYEFPKITQPGHKCGLLTLLRALSLPLFRLPALKNRHINSVRNPMWWDVIISWKPPLRLRKITPLRCHLHCSFSGLFLNAVLVPLEMSAALYMKCTRPCSVLLQILFGPQSSTWALQYLSRTLSLVTLVLNTSSHTKTEASQQRGDRWRF